MKLGYKHNPDENFRMIEDKNACAFMVPNADDTAFTIILSRSEEDFDNDICYAMICNVVEFYRFPEEDEDAS